MRPHNAIHTEMAGPHVLSSAREDAPDATAPLVSIITAVYNGERFLEQTICSVLNQTYGAIEYIIIDGGSTDGTLGIIKKYQDRISTWLSEPDRGIYDAWNKGVERAHGQWICFLGSDDILLADAIAAYVDEIGHHGGNDLDYVSSRVDLVHEDLRFMRTIGRPWEWRQFQKYNNLAHVGSFHNRRLFDIFGRYDCQYKIAGDYEFLLRAGARLKAAFMDRVTVKMRFSGISNSKAALAETMKAKIQGIGRHRLVCALEYGVGLLRLLANRGVTAVRSRRGGVA